MTPLYLLLAASAIFQLSSASTSVGCTQRDMAECVFPMTYQKWSLNLEFPLDMTYKEFCSKGKVCMDAFVTSCLDKEAQDYYSEWSETLTRVRKEICGTNALKGDITNHINCWSSDRVNQATEECKKVKLAASQFAKYALSDNGRENGLPLALVAVNTPDKLEKVTNSFCLLSKIVFNCSWPLIKECSLKSKDCLPGYLLQSMNETVTTP